VALHIHSFSARTLRSASAGWCGPLVARGVTATVGNVFEPFLQLTHRPDLLMRALGRGETFGDAVYYALPALSWQAIALGDPLYQPFKVTLEDQERAIERLPRAEAASVVIRRANLLVRGGHPADAAALLTAALRENPQLAIGLAGAKLALSRHEPAAVVRILGFLPTTGKIPADEWTLGREVARLLAANGAGTAAVSWYHRLAAAPAPAPEARRELLREAIAAAKSAGADAEDFTRESDAMTDLPPATN